MNEQIIAMAEEAGCRINKNGAVWWPYDAPKFFEKFASLVAAHERERCLNCYSPDDTVSDYQDKIRNRGTA